MGAEGRLTLPTQVLLERLLSAPMSPVDALTLSRELRIRPAVVRPIFAVLERQHWVVSTWQKPRERKPAARHRLYRLTADGIVASQAALATTAEDRAVRLGLRRATDLRSAGTSAVRRDSVSTLQSQDWTSTTAFATARNSPRS